MIRKKKPERKPRTEAIYATTSGPVTEIALWCDADTGRLSFETPVEKTFHEVTYERKSRPKVVNRTPILGPELPTGYNQALRDFDPLIAVDTNTRIVGQQNLSVTGIVLGLWATDPKDGSPAIAYHTPFCIEFAELREPREKVGWFMALGELQRRGHLSRDGNAALVVDAYLEQLASINARKTTLVGPFYLPKGVTLLYASSDVGAEYVANKLLRAADRVSTQVLDYLESGRAAPNSHLLSGRPYQSYRVVFCKQGKDV